MYVFYVLNQSLAYTAGPLLEGALCSYPAMHTAEVRHMTNGPESFTPDSQPIVGRAPEVGDGKLCT